MPVHLLIAIHKDSGTEKHISEVPSGLECNCVCPWCRKELIAKHSSKEPSDYKKAFSDHFAHHHDNECYESQLHSLAEEVIVSNSYLNLPDLSYTNYSFAKREYRIQDHWIHSYIQTKEYDIAIEIEVGEKRNRKKLKWLKNQKDLYSLSIRLDPESFPEKLNSRIGRRKITKALLVIGKNKTWLRKPEIPGADDGNNVVNKVYKALREINIKFFQLNK